MQAGADLQKTVQELGAADLTAQILKLQKKRQKHKKQYRELETYGAWRTNDGCITVAPLFGSYTNTRSVEQTQNALSSRSVVANAAIPKWTELSPPHEQTGSSLTPLEVNGVTTALRQQCEHCNAGGSDGQKPFRDSLENIDGVHDYLP